MPKEGEPEPVEYIQRAFNFDETEPVHDEEKPYHSSDSNALSDNVQQPDLLVLPSLDGEATGEAKQCESEVPTAHLPITIDREPWRCPYCGGDLGALNPKRVTQPHTPCHLARHQAQRRRSR